MSDDDFQATALADPRIGRRTYLITYSQADTDVFPTRKGFGEMIERYFNGTGETKTKVQYWACCLENHQAEGVHYHVSLKLSHSKKWKKVKEDIHRKEKISVHFSDYHSEYISAYRYVCKNDSDVYHSGEHPDLKEITTSKTSKCTIAYRQSRKRVRELSTVAEQPTQSNAVAEQPVQKKPRRLSNLDVSDFLVKHEVKNSTQLFALAKTRKDDGQSDLANFVLSRSSKSLNELIENTWKMEQAPSELQRELASRHDLLKKADEKDCIEGCNGVWLECALEVLRNNNVHPYVYASAIRESLVKGRGKFRNVMITGPANCAKTFLIKPLEQIYRVFSNPANDKYGWVGADSAEVIILQDFRWCRDNITWKDLLLLLEGEVVKLPAPKNQFATDVIINRDTPIFATSKSPVVYVGKFNSTDERETEMMSVRWKYFEFTHQIPQNEQRDVAACPHCFAKLALMGENFTL